MSLSVPANDPPTQETRNDQISYTDRIHKIRKYSISSFSAKCVTNINEPSNELLKAATGDEMA